MYRHHQVTVISDDGCRWDLAWWQLGVLVVVFIPLMDLASVQLGILSNYVDGIQDVPQVHDLNELIYGHLRNISDIFIFYF